ncbi:hypothetical protein [Mesorhizobium sp. IMUNJ 23232]|uniref:hypothetical protein n=1 Tax=Mesorhizobium sp. IMUNJ 23232 TaxID=3376064 RepID=UPI003793998E
MVGRVELQLLLGLLEAKALRFTHEALVDYHGEWGQRLIDSELMLPSGYDTTVTDEKDDLAYEVGYDNRKGALGYHHPLRGWIGVPQDSLRFYVPDLAAIFALLLGSELRPLPTEPNPLEGPAIWDVGKARLTNTELRDVWFARRLSDARMFEMLERVVQRRPSQQLRLVLTTTPATRLPDRQVPGHKIVPIDDVLSNTNIGIDIAILRARFGGQPPPPGAVLHLSEDNRVLTIHGKQLFFRKGEIIRSILRQLYDAYPSGWIRTSEVLQKACSAASSIDQAFGARWHEVKSFIEQRGGMCRFNPYLS